jgi:hypothetical protein
MESTTKALGGVACLGGCGARFERGTARLVCALPCRWLTLVWRIVYAGASRWDRWGDRGCCGLTSLWGDMGDKNTKGEGARSCVQVSLLSMFWMESYVSTEWG